MLVAMRNQKPDRVPVAPDISNMVPCRLTGKPFWDIYYKRQPPLWKAYIDAVRYYGMDGWSVDVGIRFNADNGVWWESKVLSQAADRMEVLYICHTPEGDLDFTQVFYPADPPTITRKWIKNMDEDFRKIKYMFPPNFKSYDDSEYKEILAYAGDDSLFNGVVEPPGFQHLFGIVIDGGLEEVTYQYYDNRDMILEICDMKARHELKKLEIMLDKGYEAILLGASGSITLQSPEIWDELALPFYKTATRMCREAGAVSGVHSCGKERHLLLRCFEETDLDYANPLEIPPMGDCTLADMKAAVGSKIALMGNVHTVEVMLLGTPDLVRLESLRAIRDAGQGGGFILSTGDQPGRDTPDENIRMMVETAREFGGYELDLDRIETEIAVLETRLRT